MTGAAPTTARRVRRRMPRDLPRFVLLCVLALIFLAPVYWMISTSFKTEADAISLPVQWIPTRPTLDNYREVLTSPDGNILRWTGNSLYVALAFTVLHVGLCALTAYPLARMRFPGRNAWFWFILSSLMIPGIVTLIPTYIMMLNFDWINSYHALIWPGLSGVFGVFLLRQFFLGIPRELEEAARLDGANSLQILWRIILPLSVPSLATLAVFAFMGSWNNFLWPLFTVTDVDKMTLPVGITTFSQRYVTEYGKLMAATTLAAVPALIAYLLAQRFLEAGLSTTGLKE
ncbi:carbohydrate ABC transporter permease [Deinococcus radiopugnans]|uniref:Carbohydrate ABC transporter permease n=1 Tax=Deinococcus radiopugnans ATCC 19172 TaxID=585398 RepID=A0A5C4XX97_9DEIO|nr:carbohydrate ABC transporter permease [Deinococcus radiopugnans]MBB6018387.1 multiple sugar transport system permease protein [Deinococcus radiopugnans ATCC 19172]TNM67820.1 carbohydrate ABC transporter permease [Deinococcus radiopugnans ATCC 19172]